MPRPISLSLPAALAVPAKAVLRDDRGAYVFVARDGRAHRVGVETGTEQGGLVAVAGALLGGPVVGVGTLVAAKILKNPIAQAVSYEYLVTGNWGEPVVTKLAKPVAGNAPAKP